MNKEGRFREYTRSVWSHGFDDYQDRASGWRQCVWPAVETLLTQLRCLNSEEELHAAYWEPGDWPGKLLLANLRCEPDADTLLELEHAALWMRYLELEEVQEL